MWLFKRLSFVVIFIAVIGGSVSSIHAAVIDKLEAWVNSSLILLSDVKKFRDTMPLRAQLDPLFGGTVVAEKGPSASEQDIVEFLINEKLILQEFRISDTETEQEINSIQSNNRIDRQKLKGTLKEQGFAFDDYFELIRVSTAKRNLIDRDIRSKVTITDDDVKNYYYNHYAKDSLLSYRVKMITISPENYKSSAVARDVATRSVQELQKGEPFEDVAKRVSDDPSAASGGDLGLLTESAMSPFIRTEIKKLQIGQTSSVLMGPGGKFLILKLSDVTSSDSEHYLKAKEEIRGQLIASEYQHQISLWLERQRQLAFVHRAGESPIEATVSR